MGALGCGREQLEKRLVEEETAKRVDAAVAGRVEEELKSERVQKLIQVAPCLTACGWSVASF